MKPIILLLFALAASSPSVLCGDRYLAFERDQAVWMANLDGTDEKKIADGIFPAISPYVFTGIRTSIPFAVIGAIVGEFVAATEGVGFFIRMSAGIFRTADVFVGIIVLMIMVIIMDKIAAIIEKRALRWQTQTEHIQIQA